MFGLTSRNNYPANIYNPFREMEEMERRFFGSSFDDLFRAPALTSFKTDVTDEGDHFLLEADLPGFEKAYIAQISTMVGIRESRRAVTDHVITNSECLAHAQFDDAICQSNYPVDIHGRKLNTYDIIKDSGKPYYEIPLRALIVKDVDNLLVAGRNLGAEFVAQSSIRVIPTCRAMGEAAGICAAFAIDEGRKSLHGFDGTRVREEMIARGAKFAE